MAPKNKTPSTKAATNDEQPPAITSGAGPRRSARISTKSQREDLSIKNPNMINSTSKEAQETTRTGRKGKEKRSRVEEPKDAAFVADPHTFLDPVDSELSLLGSFLRMEAHGAKLLEQANKIETRREDQIRLLGLLNNGTERDNLIQSIALLKNEHELLVADLFKQKSFRAYFIVMLLLVDKLLVETKEGANWVITLRHNYRWGGTALIPSALPKALRDDIIHMCTSSGVPNMLQS